MGKIIILAEKRRNQLFTQMKKQKTLVLTDEKKNMSKKILAFQSFGRIIVLIPDKRFIISWYFLKSLFVKAHIGLNQPFTQQRFSPPANCVDVSAGGRPDTTITSRLSCVL